MKSALYAYACTPVVVATPRVGHVLCGCLCKPRKMHAICCSSALRRSMNYVSTYCRHQGVAMCYAHAAACGLVLFLKFQLRMNNLLAVAS
jgi:hypothetical protein